MASVKVAVRVRPFNKRECELDARRIIAIKNNKITINTPKVIKRIPMSRRVKSDSTKDEYKEFTFDHSYWSFEPSDTNYADQEKIFSDLGLEVVDAAFEGYNACVFAYGQTGSGKTFTMMGSAENLGLIPRICKTLFARMKVGSASGANYRTEVSYLEIYNEKVKDLLSKNTLENECLRVREDKEHGPFVQGLNWQIVTNYYDIQEYIQLGNTRRQTASTKMNLTSSRSHAIFTIRFSQAGFTTDGMPSETISKVHLVDLAGSERASATEADDQRFKEGRYINQSLVTLGKVISGLADLSRHNLRKNESSLSKTQVFIPYRESVLTYLLKDSLGGNSKTIMIATISPADCNYAESYSTLQYANHAKKIVNKPTVNEDTSVKLIRELREEITRLKDMLNNNPQLNNSLNGRETTVLAELALKQEREKVLTEKWTEKWRETQLILQEQKALGLRKSGLGVTLDSDMPHLVIIDDDVLSTGVTLYHLKEGETLIGTEDSTIAPDIILNGSGVEQEHCKIVLENGEAILYPEMNASCRVNNVPVDKPTRLSHSCILTFGRTNTFRYNHPAEAEKLRMEGSSSQLNLSRLSLFSWSPMNLSISASAENINTEFAIQRSASLDGSRHSRGDTIPKCMVESMPNFNTNLEAVEEGVSLKEMYEQQVRQLAEDRSKLEAQALSLKQKEVDLMKQRAELEVVYSELHAKKNDIASEEKLESVLRKFSQETVENIRDLITERNSAESVTNQPENSLIAKFSSSDSKISNSNGITDDSSTSKKELNQVNQRKQELHLNLSSSTNPRLSQNGSEIKYSRTSPCDNKTLSATSCTSNTSYYLAHESNETSPVVTDTFHTADTGDDNISDNSSVCLSLNSPTNLENVDNNNENTRGEKIEENSCNSTEIDQNASNLNEKCTLKVVRQYSSVPENIQRSVSSMSSGSNIGETNNSDCCSAGDKIYTTSAYESDSNSSTELNGISNSTNKSIKFNQHMHRLRLKMSKQKSLITDKLMSNESTKDELDQLIDVLQNLQRQYIKFEMMMNDNDMKSEKKRSTLLLPALYHPLDCDNGNSVSTVDENKLYIESTYPSSSTSHVPSDCYLSDVPVWSKAAHCSQMNCSCHLEDEQASICAFDQSCSECLSNINNNSRKQSIISSNTSRYLCDEYYDGNKTEIGAQYIRSISQLGMKRQCCISFSPFPSTYSVVSEFDSYPISVPLYMLRGAGSNSHYEYEIFINLQGQRYSILRRYRKFRELHLAMQTKYGSEVKAIPFPPRQILTKTNDAIAKKRRALLESYVRRLLLACAKIKSSPIYVASLENVNVDEANAEEMSKILCDKIGVGQLVQFSQFFFLSAFETDKYGTR